MAKTPLDKVATGRSADEIRRSILADVAIGKLRRGDRLRSERDLAADFGVSRATVRLALDELERGDVVRRVPGRSGGTFISGTKIERDLSRVVGVPELLRQQGLVAGTRVVGTGVVPAADATAAALGLLAGESVFEIVRIRLAEGKPMSLEHAHFPAARFPELLELPLGGSIYELLEEHYGVHPAESLERIEVELAAPNEAAVLGVEEGSPLLSITRTTTDQDSKPFEFSHDLFCADRMRIIVRTPGSAGLVAQSHGELQDLELDANAGLSNGRLGAR